MVEWLIHLIRWVHGTGFSIQLIQHLMFGLHLCCLSELHETTTTGPFPDHFLWFYGCKWGSHSINGLTYWLTTEATTVPYKQLTNEEVWLWSFANWHQLQPSPLGTYRGVSWAPTQGCQNIWVLKPAGKSRGDMSWGWVLFRTKTMWDSLNAINHP